MLEHARLLSLTPLSSSPSLSMLAYFLLSRLAGGGGGAEGGAGGSSSSNVFVRAAAAVRSALHWAGARIKAWLRSGGRERVSGCGSRFNRAAAMKAWIRAGGHERVSGC